MTRWMMLAGLMLALGCQGHKDCPGFTECVSSQDEADRRNAGNDCRNYVYCPDAGESGGQDASPDTRLFGDGATAAE
jgi:hypothetical protein